MGRGKLLKYHLKGMSCRDWAVGLNINNSENTKNGPPGAHLPSPPGSIHVIYHNIQTSSPLASQNQRRTSILYDGKLPIEKAK